MDTEQKPFACKTQGCGMSFTNDDHLNVHRKKHDMILNLGQSGSSKSSTFIADQTPTPTRLIRNCDEVGLFDDLQHVNPFEETFRRAVESKSDTNKTDTHARTSTNLLIPSSNHLEVIAIHNEDTLHTPQLAYFTINTPEEIDVKEESSEFAVKGQLERPIKTIELNNTVSVINEPSSRRVSSESDQISKTTINNLKNVIVVPQITVLQAAPICEVPTKRFKPILPAQVQTQPQLVQFITTNDHQQRPRARPLKKLYPKIEITQPFEINPVKEKLKEALLKTKAHTQSVIARTRNTEISSQNKQVQIKTKKIISKSTNIPLNRSSTASSDTTTRPNDKAKPDNIFERNRAAARRYRKKLKNRQNEIKRRNNELESENQRLKTELKALKILLLAHQDCSVSRSLASGKSIQIGLQTTAIHQPAVTPTVIVNPKSLNQKDVNNVSFQTSTNKSNAPS